MMYYNIINVINNKIIYTYKNIDKFINSKECKKLKEKLGENNFKIEEVRLLETIN